VILVNRSFRSALSAWLAKIPVRIGHATEFRGHFLTKSLAYSPVLPESECYSQLGRLAGIPIDASLRPHLQLSPEEEALGADMVQRLGIAQGLVGLQPGARSAERALPISVSVSVARQLSDMGLHPVLLGAASELEWASKVEAEASVPLSNAVGTLEMRPAMALIRQMMCVVGADTGLMHLAAGLGVPTVTVFGPNPSSKWGHFDPPHQVVEAPAGVMALTSSADVLSAVNRAVSCLRGSSEPVLK